MVTPFCQCHCLWISFLPDFSVFAFCRPPFRASIEFHGAAVGGGPHCWRRVVWNQWVPQHLRRSSSFSSWGTFFLLNYTLVWTLTVLLTFPLLDGVAAADPCSDWNAPAEHWGNYEEPLVAAMPPPLTKPLPNQVCCGEPFQGQLFPRRASLVCLSLISCLDFFFKFFFHNPAPCFFN